MTIPFLIEKFTSSLTERETRNLKKKKTKQNREKSFWKRGKGMTSRAFEENEKSLDSRPH